MSNAEHLHNFHSHTFRCKHATGDVKDYCEEALKLGMNTLGVTDHTALPDDRWIEARMAYTELPDYVGVIDQAKLDFPQLKVLKGMECEYLPEYDSYYRDELFDQYGFDYLIGAAHFFPVGDQWFGAYTGILNRPDRLKAIADYTILMMETGLFDFIAHPDVFAMNYQTWDENAIACSRDIFQAAVDLDVGLELNGLGIKKQDYKAEDFAFPIYPWYSFWEEASGFDVKIVINSDAHNPKDLQQRTRRAQEMAAELGLKFMDHNSIGLRQSKC
jgi:histidinol-phosphatase (PHP family)